MQDIGTGTDKLKQIAESKGCDIATFDGKIIALKAILEVMTKEESEHFLLDTFMMLDDEIIAYEI